MPMSMLRLRPGVNAELTPSQLQAGYATSSLIRFRAGLAEKLGGWDKYYPNSVGGVPKALHAWLDLNETRYLGIGSTTILGAISGGSLNNLTPQTYTSNFAPDFTTTLGSPNVTVNDPNIANVTSFDSVEFKTPVSVGGIILSGVYPINLVLGVTQYRIVAATNATATVASGGAVPVFNTTSSSSTVAVTLNSHGLAAGDSIVFPLSTTVGGVTIDGTYSATAISSSNAFNIAVDAVATSTTSGSMNSGNARITYYIALGPTTAGTGYGIGTYGSGAYGTGSSAGAQTGTQITATDWTLDNWGEILLACPDGGGIYQWRPNTGFQNAQLISGSGAPLYNTGMFVSMQTQMAIAYGSTEEHEIGIDQDPLLVKWSAQSDYTSWQVSTTSQAGSRRLPTGSKIVGGMSVPNSEFLWTDLDLWSMNYLGSLAAGVWGFSKIGSNCGLIAKHAAVRQGSAIYWMGASNFWVTGNAQPAIIPCDVWDIVFQDLNTDYQDRCWAWSNSPFNEIWWFFPRASTNATQPDYYVKYNIRENVWDHGPMDRTCGIDQSIVGMPIAAASSGIVYEHEVSKNADGQPLVSSFSTGWFPLSDGEDMIFIDWILPDMKWGTANAPQTASINITLYSVYYPGDTPTVYGPFTVTQSTQYINPRLRGRLAMYTIESTDLDSFWRLGGHRSRWAPDGRY